MTRWHAFRPDQLRLVAIDTGAAVFNPLSWETHIVPSNAARVLETLRAGASDLETLERAFSGDGTTPSTDREERREALLALLDELEGLGLVIPDDEPADDPR